MGASQTVDVRDMLCAQALAVVAQAMASLRPGETLEIHYNAQDVKQDVLTWAHGLGHPAEAPDAARLTLRKR